MRSTIQLLLLITLFMAPVNFLAKPSPQSAPNIAITAASLADKVQRGRTVQATVVMDIPSGFHVNSSRPLEKFLIPTQLRIDAAKGIRVSPVSYPRPVMRNFKFSKSKVSVYEGRATMRFSVTVPASFSSGTTELKAHLRYQSCNDEVCFPPQTRDVSLWLNVQ
jgi:DsbC/DsbD-like thiol-disulfide interchange protein